MAPSNVAVVVLDNLSGEWLAWEGSGDFLDESARRIRSTALRSPRQPGSTLKPFTYALAFEQGATPATVLPDIPSHFPDRRTRRRLQPAQLRRTLSWAAARAARARRIRKRPGGRARIAASAFPACSDSSPRAGFTTFDRTPSYYGLGLTLGNAECSLDQLVAAYSAFARGGEWIAANLARGTNR